MDLSARYLHKRYGGAFADAAQAAMGRRDDLITAGATLDYFLRNWAFAGVGYSAMTNYSNIATVEYLKQQMLVRLGITY